MATATTLSSSAMRTNAADIPPELFENIIEHLMDTEGIPTEESYYGDKRPASICGRVCKYWARLCRPMLFQTIQVKRDDDLNDLMALLQTPPPDDVQPIGHCLEGLVVTLQHQSAEIPWFHHFYLRPLSHLVRGPLTMTVLINGVERVKTAGLHGLPRNVACRLVDVSILILESFHFRDAAEFRRFVAHFKYVERLELRDITWDVRPDAAAFASMYRVLSARCDWIDSSGVESALLAAWIFPMVLSHWKRFVISPEEYSVLLELFQALVVLDEKPRLSVTCCKYHVSGNFSGRMNAADTWIIQSRHSLVHR